MKRLLSKFLNLKSNFSILLVMTVAISLQSCQNGGTVKNEPSSTKPTDSIPVNRDVTDLVKNAGNSSFNNFARFIAGSKQNSENNYSKLEKDSLWLVHSNNMRSKWNLMTSLRTNKLTAWAEKELPKPLRESEVLFYPFSGADILNANLLFPQAKSFYMFGLEPVGYLPDVLLNANGRDSLRGYFHALNTSLDAITHYSFFRTNSMKVDFKDDEMNGVIHLLLVFLSRNHNDIADIRYVYIDENGVQQTNIDRKVTHNDGVEIVFTDSLKNTHFVTYYSVNLDNKHLDDNQGVQNYIKHLGHVNTYLKAASYLMYNTSFSKIRTMILEQTKYLLQDDSGIPYHYFTDNKDWNATLFGVYVPPISLFANRYQRDLDSAYHDSTRIQKPLNFGIGYNFTKSNLMLFEKK